MKLNYYPETDSLYIDLSENPSAESREISEGVVLDYDASGKLVGIDIDNASMKAEIHRLVVNRLPASVENNWRLDPGDRAACSSAGLQSIQNVKQRRRDRRV